MKSTHPTPFDLRDDFWGRWLDWKERGAVLVADCCWPVEARFLAACVDDSKTRREWDGPYPLHDLASVLLALGRDPLATNERLPTELPAHHPLNDARQSARLLIVALASAHSKEPGDMQSKSQESMQVGDDVYSRLRQALEHCEQWLPADCAAAIEARETLDYVAGVTETCAQAQQMGNGGVER